MKGGKSWTWSGPGCLILSLIYLMAPPFQVCHCQLEGPVIHMRRTDGECNASYTTCMDGASCDILTTNGANLFCAIELCNSFVRLSVDKDNPISQSVAVTATPRYAYGRLTYCVR